MGEKVLQVSGLIELKQLPILEEQLCRVKNEWETIAEDAKDLVCTDETLTAVKAKRAEVNKQFAEIENVRKAVKAQYMAQWDAFEGVYKDCITNAYRDAEAALKTKITAVEEAIKAQCEERCRAYFAEICEVHGIDFVNFEQFGIKIGLTDARQKTPRKLFDEINNKVAGIACGLDDICRICSEDEKPEVIAEYKKSLNVPLAIQTVKARRAAAEAERETAQKIEEQRAAEIEHTARVEVAASGAEPEEVLTVTFKATATRHKLIKLREFMKKEGIIYA